MARIGLVGFFGWGNYGDELFLENWRATIGLHHEVEVVHDMLSQPYFSRPAVEVVKDFDALVIGGGDLVIPNKISPLYWNRAWLAKPIYISGVGVPTWIKHQAPDVMERLRNFFQHENVRHIGVRDQESAHWVRRELAPKVPVEAHADLAFNLLLPPAVKFDRPTIGINLRSHRAGSDPAALVKVCQTYADRGYDVVNIVLGTGRTRTTDLEVARAFPFDRQVILESEDTAELSSYLGGLDVLVSNKFHGTVVATMYGVSSVVLSSTTKSRNLYRRLSREHLLSTNEDPDMLRKVELAAAPVSSAAVRQLEVEANAAVRTLVGKLNADFRPSYKAASGS
ncbi:polysaccharide pyruvyl transferase family protein [Desertihabitans brevis]|nr:polysaccharide pyruvyl transferase family protein [Desertihabitans brevis]